VRRTIRLAPDLDRALLDESRRTGTGISDIVRRAIVAYLGTEKIRAPRPAPIPIEDLLARVDRIAAKADLPTATLAVPRRERGP
jgi:hypothetical protein